jgi:hypothetical protein
MTRRFPFAGLGGRQSRGNVPEKDAAGNTRPRPGAKLTQIGGFLTQIVTLTGLFLLFNSDGVLCKYLIYMRNMATPYIWHDSCIIVDEQGIVTHN